MDEIRWRPREAEAWVQDPANDGERLAFDAFTQAMQFHAGGRRCLASVIAGRNISDMLREDTPGFVNMAFACELYLKSLQLIGSGTAARGHKLRTLFDELPPTERDAIATHFAAMTLKGRAEFDQILDTMSDTFERWRYIYEGKERPIINMWGLIHVPAALLKRVRLLRPGWPAHRLEFLQEIRLPTAQFGYLGEGPAKYR